MSQGERGSNKQDCIRRISILKSSFTRKNEIPKLGNIIFASKFSNLRIENTKNCKEKFKVECFCKFIPIIFLFLNGEFSEITDQDITDPFSLMTI